MSDAVIYPDLAGQSRERAAVAEPLAARMAETMRRLLANAPLELLKSAAAAPTGAGSLATLVGHLPEADPTLADADPEAAALARAADEKRRLIETVPTLTAAEVARRLNITPSAVRKARGERRMLAVELGAEQRYPLFQFAESQVRPGVREVLAALDAAPVRSPWAQLDLLTAPDAVPDGRSVAELLRDGDIDAALAAIHAYGEGGA
ncbi:MAG TPA: hypothetical protein VFY16_14255 [Gemmatimonadaceae bacterium]|nr:hypothetical protein [Gemmatimonadaceae bacterium]